MASALERAVAKVRAASAHLPEIELGSTFGDPALKVRGKLLAVVKDADTLYLRCALEDKEMLFESAPEIYYETDHYKGWPGLLVRLGKIKKDELSVRLERAWRIQAPKKLVKAFDGAAPKPKRKT